MPKEPTLVTITISGLPIELRDELDRLADEEHRDRSGQVVKLIEAALEDRRAEQPRKQRQAA